MGGRPLDDSELIKRTQDGDRSAYGELVRRYQEIALRAAYLVTGSSADAEEAVQEGFVKGYRAIARFREAEPFRPWIVKIVTNEARNIRRSSNRKFQLAVKFSQQNRRGLSGGSGDAVPSPESAAIQTETIEELVGQVSKLREEERLVVAYRYLLDLSEAETASALGIRRGTVKSRLSRGLNKLRDSMREPEE